MRLCFLLVFSPACAVAARSPTAGTPAVAPTAAAAPATTPPAAAHRDAYGNLVGPSGGLQMGNMTCDAAHEHCIRGATWFMTDPDSGYPDATPAFEFEGAFYPWERSTDPYAGEAHRTVVATPDNVRAGVEIVVFDLDGRLPYSESNAQTQSWTYGVVGEVDGDRLQLAGGGAWIPLAGARVVVESR